MNIIGGNDHHNFPTLPQNSNNVPFGPSDPKILPIYDSSLHLSDIKNIAKELTGVIDDSVLKKLFSGLKNTLVNNQNGQLTNPSDGLLDGFNDNPTPLGDNDGNT
ncbi:MAG: hypothetical protein ACPGJI_09050, partial [Kangiellaceae bacterium]